MTLDDGVLSWLGIEIIEIIAIPNEFLDIGQLALIDR